MTVRIKLDRPRCAGFGFCAEVAPEFFEIDDDGILTVLREDVPEGLEEKIKEAARVCPVAAIRLGL